MGFFSFVPAYLCFLGEAKEKSRYLCGDLFSWLTSFYENGVVYHQHKEIILAIMVCGNW